MEGDLVAVSNFTFHRPDPVAAQTWTERERQSAFFELCGEREYLRRLASDTAARLRDIARQIGLLELLAKVGAGHHFEPQGEYYVCPRCAVIMGSTASTWDCWTVEGRRAAELAEMRRRVVEREARDGHSAPPAVAS
jgi:hypothetical protein